MSVDAVLLVEGVQSLSGRMSNFQPTYIQAQKIKPFPLSDVKDTRAQEGLIIDDLLYVLIGLEGSYIRYSERYDPQLESLRQEGPDYRINKSLDSSLKDLTKKLVHLSKMYVALTTFTEVFNTASYGQVLQSFVYEIRQFLKKYIKFIDNIGHQFKFNKDFSLRQLEQDLRTNVTSKMNHLYEIIKTIYTLNEIRKSETPKNAFDNFVENIRTDLQKTGSIDLLSDTTNHHIVKGGLVIQIIQDRLDSNTGDFKSNEFLAELLRNISRGYITMLNDWITKGQLNDPHNEFFISTNLVHDFKLNNFNAEQYWDSKFVIKTDGLPKQFSNKDLQIKVLLTGKYLNVLKECGVTLDLFSNNLVASLDSSNLLLILEEAYSIANNYIIDLLLNGYDFDNVLKELKTYYLLPNASNINNFLSSTSNELKKAHNHVSSTKLRRAFNSIYNLNNDSDFILKLLNVTIEKESIYEYLIEILKVEAIDAEVALHSNNFDTIKQLITKTLDNNEDGPNNESKSVESLKGINFINFDIILPFPLNLIITRTNVIQYQLIFRHLLNLHFADQILNESWLEINKNKIWKYKYFDKPIPKWITRARSLHDRMKDFFKIYFSFLTTDVIEINWSSFQNEFNNLNEAEDINLNLQKFLNTVLKNSILTNEKLIKIFSRLIHIISAYCGFLLSLRKVLILLNFELFEKYSDRLKGQYYDYNKNLERLEKLNAYLNEYLDSFNQHLNGLIEGLKYYGELETPEFLILAQRLKQSFPNANEQ